VGREKRFGAVVEGATAAPKENKGRFSVELFVENKLADDNVDDGMTVVAVVRVLDMFEVEKLVGNKEEDAKAVDDGAALEELLLIVLLFEGIPNENVVFGFSIFKEFDVLFELLLDKVIGFSVAVTVVVAAEREDD